MLWAIIVVGRRETRHLVTISSIFFTDFEKKEVGTSVLELVNAFKEANNVDIPYVIAPRRAGDVSQCFASSDKAFNEIGFKAKYNIYDACRDSWNWQKKNPNGLN